MRPALYKRDVLNNRKSSCINHDNYGSTFKQSLGVLLFQGQQLTSSLPDPRQRVLDPPHLALVPQSVFTNDLQFLVQASLLEGPARSDVGLGEDRGYTVVHHDGEL